MKVSAKKTESNEIKRRRIDVLNENKNNKVLKLSWILNFNVLKNLPLFSAYIRLFDTWYHFIINFSSRLRSITAFWNDNANVHKYQCWKSIWKWRDKKKIKKKNAKMPSEINGLAPLIKYYVQMSERFAEMAIIGCNGFI